MPLLLNRGRRDSFSRHLMGCMATAYISSLDGYELKCPVFSFMMNI
jgi:hypothetical protein